MEGYDNFFNEIHEKNVARIPEEERKKIYTDTCNCIAHNEYKENLEKLLKDGEIVQFCELKMEYTGKYINNLLTHVNPHLVSIKPCYGKREVFVRSLFICYKSHLTTLELFLEQIKKDDREYIISLPKFTGSFLDIFGSPQQCQKLIKVKDYVVTTLNIIKSLYNFSGRLLRSEARSEPTTLISHIKLEVLTLRILRIYLQLRQHEPRKILTQTKARIDKLEESTETPIGVCEN